MKDDRVVALYRQIGHLVRSARRKLGFSQEKLADCVGLSRVSVVNIEKGRQRPPIHVLVDIADTLGLEPTQLLPKSSESRLPDAARDASKEIKEIASKLVRATTGKKERSR